jgi:hypothetical protein
MYCRLASMVFKKARGRGIVWRCLQRMYIPFLKENSRRTVAAFIDIFAYLNFKYLVAAFYRLGHLLRERLGVLGALNMGHCIGGYSDVLLLDIVPSESFTRHGTHLVEGHMEKILANVQKAIYSLVAPCDLLSVTSGYCASCIFIRMAL